MHEIVRRLVQLNRELPSRFSREIAAQGPFVQGFLGLIERRTNPVKEVKNILISPEMTDLISSGHITIAMIKPRLDIHMDKSTVQFNSDGDLAAYLEDQITTLKPVLSLSMKMTRKMLDEFYGRPQPDGSNSPKQSMMSKEVSPGRTVWQEFQELMDSGPVTFVVLYDEDSDATQKWRKEMGTDFNVDRIKLSQPQSLRARFAKWMKNNLLHGSDSIKSALIERDFIANHIK